MKYRQKPGNGMWVVDYEDSTGARKRVSTGIKTAPMNKPPAEVREVGREIVLGIRTPKIAGASSERQARQRDGRMTVSDLLDKCEGTIWHPDEVRAQETIRSNVKFWRARLGDEAIADMTYTRLDAVVSDMKAEGYQPATIKRKLAMLSRALSQATLWVDDNEKPLLLMRPRMPRIVVNNLKDRIIEPAEEEAIFLALEKRRQLEPHRPWFKFRVFLWLLFDTGGRLGESIGLGPKELTHQRFGDQEVTFLTFPRYRTKSGKPRTVPLAQRSIEALGSLMEHLTLDKVTQEFRFFGFTDSTADVMFRQVRCDVKTETGMDLSDVTLHTIRHTVLTRLAQGGMDLARLQQWAGHSDPKITAQRYLHLRPSDLVGGLSILNGTGGTAGASKAWDRISPVTVPNTHSGAKGATAGTGTLQ